LIAVIKGIRPPVLAASLATLADFPRGQPSADKRTSPSIVADIDIPRIPTESGHKMMSKLGHEAQ
jgi:hypothetical protein